MTRFLRWFAGGWAALILLANAVSVAGIFMTAPSPPAAFAEVQEIYSPFNIHNWAMEALSLLPAFIALNWAAKRQLRIERRS